jgi:chromosome segregation ATPase
MSDLSLGERIAMGLAEKCAQLESERDEARGQLRAAHIAIEEADKREEEALRERDEARAVDAAEGEASSWRAAAEAFWCERDEARAAVNGAECRILALETLLANMQSQRDHRKIERDEARAVAQEFAELLETVTEGRAPTEEDYKANPWLSMCGVLDPCGDRKD